MTATLQKSLAVSNKVICIFLNDSAIPILNIFKSMLIQRNCTQMYIAALSVIAKNPETSPNVPQLEKRHIWKVIYQ